MFAAPPSLIPSGGGGRDVGFKLSIQINQADFINWMSFLPSNDMKEISLNPNRISQYGIA